LSPELLRGESRLGAHAFNEAAAALPGLVRTLGDLRVEDWDEIDPNDAAQIKGSLSNVTRVIQEMLNLSTNETQFQVLRDRLQQQFNEAVQAFNGFAQPHRIAARVQREVQRARERSEAQAMTVDHELPARVNAAQELLRDLQDRTESLASALDAREAAIQAVQAEAGTSGAADLSSDYASRADAHRGQSESWGARLALAVAAAGILGGAVLLVTQPSGDASNAEIVAHLAFDVLVVGLLIYIVRIAAHQYSVHRHLEAVARNKAAALKTFGRIVSSGSDADTRAALTTVLAQAVFSSDQTGFIDPSTNQVTLIEGLGHRAIDRLNPPA
jgi:hypothetical protein